MRRRSCIQAIMLLAILTSTRLFAKDLCSEKSAIPDQHIYELIGLLNTEQDDHLRGVAIADLIQMGDIAVGPLKCAMQEGNVYFKDGATKALRSMGMAGVRALLDLLESDNEDIRRFAAFAFEESPDPRAVEPLIGLLSTDDKYLRISVIKGLGKLGGARALAALESHARKETDPSIEDLVRSAVKYASAGKGKVKGRVILPASVKITACAVRLVDRLDLK